MTQALSDRLARPTASLDLVGLAAQWSWVRVGVRVGGYGHLAHDLMLSRRVRGAIGRVLMRSASDQALAGLACPWQPPCALDVFFREQGRIGAHGIPKPFVLWTDRRGSDLVVGITIFGLAIDWAPVMTHALVDTVRHRIDFRAVRPNMFAPPTRILAVDVTEGRGVVAPRELSDVELRFLTPMNAEGDDPIDRPATILARLARRVEGLARWHDVTVHEDWVALGRVWAALDYDTAGLGRETLDRRSGRAERDFRAEAVTGTVCVLDVPTPLLAIGATAHVGKGAVEGHGRFRVSSGRGRRRL